MLKKLKEYKLFETGPGAGKDKTQFKYPGVRDAVDGNTAVIHVEREASDAAGAYPITPSTQMGEYWAEASAAGHLNISDRPLIFIEPESEHAAAGVTAGMSMTAPRSCSRPPDDSHRRPARTPDVAPSRARCCTSAA